MLIIQISLNLSTLKNVSFVILLLQMCLVFGQKKVIVIDPGHGGIDSGAIGINHLLEKDVVLGIAKEILRLNKTVFEDSFDIYLTRYTDTLISLSDRSRLAKSLKADVFVSLYCNHSNNPDVRGIEVYVANSKSEYSKESIWLSFQFQVTFNANLGFESRGLKFSNFQVLRQTIDSCASVLLELGFLSNLDEAAYLKKSSNINRISFSILTVIHTLILKQQI